MARAIYSSLYNAPDNVPRPYYMGMDYYQAVPLIEEELQDRSTAMWLMDTLNARLGEMQKDDRHYEFVHETHFQLYAYVNGEFSLFNHRHDAPQQERSFVEQVAEDAARLAAEQPPAYERFSVIETEDGYAVWDDIRDEIYVDSEGVRETFPSEWQAEDYLEQVRKAVNEKEAAEWLYVEQSRNTAAKPEQPQSEPVSTADPVIVGTRLTIDGRQFEVDSVDDHTQNVSLRDVTFDGGSAAKHGLNIYHAGMVTLENVEISNCRWYALVVNGTELSVDGLTTSGNQWGVNTTGQAASPLRTLLLPRGIPLSLRVRMPPAA